MIENPNVKAAPGHPEPLESGSRPIVETTGLAKTFAIDGSEVIALTGVDLSVNAGEFISFVGPSGCGKSTLLNMIAGLLPRTAGEARIEGKLVEEPSRQVGFMFQTPVLLPWRSVESNVLMPAEVFGLDAGTVRDRALEVIEAVGLGSVSAGLSATALRRHAAARGLGAPSHISAEGPADG